MRDGGIGRILVAALHQGIADVLPDRLEFYENWVHPAGLRAGRIGLAPITAVLSFLRREGDAYSQVMARAGEYAGEWTVEGLPRMRRRAVRLLPRVLRARAALGIGRALVHQTYGGSRAIVLNRRGTHQLSDADDGPVAERRDRRHLQPGERPDTVLTPDRLDA